MFDEIVTLQFTPQKINMEPENTLLEKENHLIFRFHVNLRGVYIKLHMFFSVNGAISLMIWPQRVMQRGQNVSTGQKTGNLSVIFRYDQIDSN